jgi:hypothetical protein
MKPTYAIENIDTQQIDPSPFQKRKHFVKEKLQDLAASIENDDPVNRVNTLLGKLNSVVNNQNKQSPISESLLQ